MKFETIEEKVVRLESILDRISGRLSGIAEEDLTTAEKQIKKILDDWA